MTKYSHLVVTYNHDTHEFDYDVETTLSKFRDGCIWDDVAQEWTWAENSTDDGNDTDAVDTIALMFMRHNERLKTK